MLKRGDVAQRSLECGSKYDQRGRKIGVDKKKQIISKSLHFTNFSVQK